MRKILEKKSFELNKIHNKKNISYMMTKVMTKKKHGYCKSRIGIVRTFYIG